VLFSDAVKTCLPPPDRPLSPPMLKDPSGFVSLMFFQKRPPRGPTDADALFHERVSLPPKCFLYFWVYFCYLWRALLPHQLIHLQEASPPSPPQAYNPQKSQARIKRNKTLHTNVRSQSSSIPSSSFSPFDRRSYRVPPHIRTTIHRPEGFRIFYDGPPGVFSPENS